MLIKKILITGLILYISIHLFSKNNSKDVLFKEDSFKIPYTFNDADKSWELPGKLVEISGLSYMDKKRLACIQDERGNIYVFNTKKGKIESKIDFGDDGDYEGIEIIGKDAWVLKNNGTLIHVKNYQQEDQQEIIKYNTELTSRNDTEGFAFDASGNRLIIACKGHPFIDHKKGKKFKALYQFNIEKTSLDINPILLINLDTLKRYKNYHPMTLWGIEFLSKFDESKGDLSFQPSGAAIHPISGDLYILGAVGNLLLIYSEEGRMKAMINLKSKVHPQPEGICFNPDGTLYISNEGGNDKGKILQFKMK